jgi:hypothetical protein
MRRIAELSRSASLPLSATEERKPQLTNIHVWGSINSMKSHFVSESKQKISVSPSDHSPQLYPSNIHEWGSIDSWKSHFVPERNQIIAVSLPLSLCLVLSPFLPSDSPFISLPLYNKHTQMGKRQLFEEPLRARTQSNNRHLAFGTASGARIPFW